MAKINMVTVMVIDMDNAANAFSVVYSLKPNAIEQLRQYLKSLEQEGLALSMEEVDGTEGDND